jgi:ABC-2 type transport system ATP-binding protein
MTESATIPISTTGRANATDATLALGPPIIEIQGLVKRYGNSTAVDGIDLSVREREVFGILGPNGAGKTTTLEMIEGLRRPDAGTIRVAGLDGITQSDQIRRIIGVQLQTTALFDYLTSSELIDLFAGLYDVDVSPGWAEELRRMVGLEEKQRARVEQMSGGQQQRLSIALALVNRPKIVFLDEPTTGLDPQARRNLWETVRQIRASGVTVVLTTHYMEEAEQLCDRVAVMDRGRVIACDTPLALIRGLDIAATVRARIAAGSLPAVELAALPGVIEDGETERRRDGGNGGDGGDGNEQEVVLQTRDAQATLTGLLELATRHGVTLANLGSTQADLEDVFLNLTGRKYEGEAVSDQPSAVSKGRRGR